MMIHILMLLALAQDAEKAQTLHGEMLSAILDARTLQCDYRCEAKSGGIVAKSAQGKLLMQQPDNFYHKFEVKAGDKTEALVTISDGTSVKYGDKPAQPIPAGMSKNWKGIVGILGLSTHFFNKSVRNVKPEMKNFAWGRPEDSTQAVSYTIDIGKPDLSIRTTVWIDVKTKLPKRRTTVIKSGADEAEVTDFYSAFYTGDKIDPKMFVVPK